MDVERVGRRLFQVAGVVSLVTGHEHRQAERRSIKRFAGALLALAALFAVGMATLAYQTGSFS